MHEIGRPGLGDREAGGNDDRVAWAGETMFEAPPARLGDQIVSAGEGLGQGRDDASGQGQLAHDGA